MRTGEKIKKAREARGLTQEQLAKLLDKKQPYIARLESGKYNPRLDILRKIAKVLGVEPKDLI
ncbi:MAG: helix-turn-helix transcriptional regulator [Ignavibacteriales bacterium]